MTEQQWEEHNESFSYEPPEEDPELWSQDQYTELYDRVIRKDMHGWKCQVCSKAPFRRLRSARSHIEQNHSDRLIEKAVARQ